MDDTKTTEKPRRRGAFGLLFNSPASRVTWPPGDEFKPPVTVEDVDAIAQQMFTVSSGELTKAIHTVVLCGSTRFLRLFHEWSAQLSTQGFVVMSLGVNRSKDFTVHLSPHDKAVLDAVHFQKIAMADAVLVITGPGQPIVGQPAEEYIGESTAREIAFAESIGRPVFYTGTAGVSKEYTSPLREPWANYRDDQLHERIRDTWSRLRSMLQRSPSAMLAMADTVYDGDAHEEYGWHSKIDEAAMAEEPDLYPAGARHELSFSTGIGDCIMVIDENEFDEEEGEQRVRWHLEVMTPEERAERERRHQAALRDIGLGKMTGGDIGVAEDGEA
jgi:hypothetical protein